MTNPLLTIRNLKVTHASAKKGIIHGVNLTIHAGEVVALVGPSGSGKSLTAMAILGLLPPDLQVVDGDISFRDGSLMCMTEEELRCIRGKEIGMIFQDPLSFLNPTMTIGKQISETLIFHKKLTHREALIATYELLEDMGIPDPRERYGFYPFQFSGGQRQRVMIASAMACKPALLLADEPTTALDPTTQAQILALIRHQVTKNNMSLLFITHDLRVAESVADRIAVMHEGIIVEDAPKEQFFLSQSHEQGRSLVAQYRRRYCG